MPKRVNWTITISEEIDREFRQAVNDRLGYKKGNLQKAVEEAFWDWINKEMETRK